jgi:predicted transcriptional regulator
MERRRQTSNRSQHSLQIPLIEHLFKDARFAPRILLSWFRPQWGWTMTAFTLGEAMTTALTRIGGSKRIHASAPHRPGAPVRRGSIEAGSFERTFFTVPAQGETDRLLRIARRTLDTGRRLAREERMGTRRLSYSERAIAALTAGAVRVYEELLALARLNQGQVFPSYDHLAKATALGRATVARALNQLETIGFLIRQRRFKRIKVQGAGPRYAQTSNAYRFALPKAVIAYLPRWMRPVPPQDDVIQAESDRREVQAAMLSRLSCRELSQATLSGPLGRVLARLGARIDALDCESHHDPQPRMDSII